MDSTEVRPVGSVAEFKLYGLSASFHYADDSTREWALGDTQKYQALKIFDGNPEHQAEMREVAKDFLWSLELERKSSMDDDEINAAAEKLYNECPTPKPKWADLGSATRSVWIDRVSPDGRCIRRKQGDTSQLRCQHETGHIGPCDFVTE